MLRAEVRGIDMPTRVRFCGILKWNFNEPKSGIHT